MMPTLSILGALGISTLLFTALLVGVGRILFSVLLKSTGNLSFALFAAKALGVMLYAGVVAVAADQVTGVLSPDTPQLAVHGTGLCLAFAFLAAQIYNSRAALVAGRYPPAVVAGFLRYDPTLYVLAGAAYFLGPRLSFGTALGENLLQASGWLIGLAVVGRVALAAGLIVMAIMLWLAAKELSHQLAGSTQGA